MKTPSPVFALTALAAFSTATSRADGVVPYHFVDVWYDWSAPIADVGATVTVAQDPGAQTTYYWSHYFIFTGSPSGADPTGTGMRAGYMGLQTDAGSKTAIFSIWNALGAQGDGCGNDVQVETGGDFSAAIR